MNDVVKTALKNEIEAVQRHIAALAVAIKTLTTEAIETVKREYEPGRVQKAAGGGVGIPTHYLEVKYDPKDIIPPGDVRTYYFGVDYDVPNSGVPGLPETVQKSFGIWPRALIAKGFEVDDDIAANFAITGAFFGARSLWHPGLKVPATRFATSAPSIPPFDEIVHAGLVVTVNVENASETACPFHMKIIGEEIVDPKEVVASAAIEIVKAAS